jgi:hypothetical protein
VPRSISGTPKRRFEDAEDGGARGDPEVAPQRKLHPAGDRRAFDRGDHRLAKLEPRRAHRAERAVRLDRPRLALGDRLEIGPGAERSPRAGQHRDVRVGVGVEALKGLKQSPRGHKIDRVAPLGPLDRDHRHPTVGADGNGRCIPAFLFHGAL